MTVQGLIPGERVSVTVHGVVESASPPHGDDVVDVVLRYGLYRTVVHVAAPHVDTARAAPWDWPPLDGDVWVDRTGVEWFCRVLYDTAAEGVAELVCVSEGKPYRDEAESVNDSFGPLELARRRGWLPGPVPAPPGPWPAAALLARIAEAVRFEGLPCPMAIEWDPATARRATALHRVHLRLADGVTTAVDMWAAHLEAPVPKETPGSALAWRTYRTVTDWLGWHLNLWCTLPDPADHMPAVPARERGPGDALTVAAENSSAAGDTGLDPAEDGVAAGPAVSPTPLGGEQ